MIEELQNTAPALKIFFDNVNLILASIAVLLTTLSSFASKKANGSVKGVRIDIAKILQSQVEMNDAQQIEIETLVQEMAKLTKFVDAKTEREKFIRKVHNVGDSVVRSVADLNKDSVAKTLKTSRSAAKFLVETGENLKRDFRLVESDAYGVAFVLSQNHDFSKLHSERFCSQLRLFLEGNYNGSTQAKFEEMALAWVTNLLESGARPT